MADHSEAGNAGMCNEDSIEIGELRHPIFVHPRRLLPDTEGAGRFRGAVSAYAEFSPVGCDMTVAYVSDGNFNPARGTRGGGLGAPWSQFRLHADGSLEPVGNCAEVVIRPDEAMVSYSCGGGGYGPPHERSIERAAHDVSEGCVSRERAEAIYGVAVDADGSVDEARHRRVAPGERGGAAAKDHPIRPRSPTTVKGSILGAWIPGWADDWSKASPNSSALKSSERAGARARPCA